MGKIKDKIMSNKPIIDKKKQRESSSNEFLVGDTRDSIQDKIAKEKKRYI